MSCHYSNNNVHLYLINVLYNEAMIVKCHITHYNCQFIRVGVKETKNIGWCLPKIEKSLKIHWTETELCQQNV